MKIAALPSLRLLSLAICFFVALTTAAVRNEISLIYDFYKNFHEPIRESDCANFLFHYSRYKSWKPGENFDRDFLIMFKATNGDLINLIESRERASTIELTKDERRKICIEYKSDEIIKLISETHGISDAYKINNLSQFYLYKIVINILFTLLGALVIYAVLTRVKKQSEGLFRLLATLVIPLVIVPHILPSYSIIATPTTQSFTYPATALLVFFLAYKLIKWIRDGFRSG